MTQDDLNNIFDTTVCDLIKNIQTMKNDLENIRTKEKNLHAELLLYQTQQEEIVNNLAYKREILRQVIEENKDIVSAIFELSKEDFLKTNWDRSQGSSVSPTSPPPAASAPRQSKIRFITGNNAKTNTQAKAKPRAKTKAKLPAKKPLAKTKKSIKKSKPVSSSTLTRRKK